jgi:hypothetical protein
VEIWIGLSIAIVVGLDGWFNLNEQPDLIERIAKRLNPDNPGKLRRVIGSGLMLLALAYLGALLL